jgi:ribonucleoside-diphosphate reductase alpha chain
MGTKPEVVGMLYEMGWKKGLKGITVYVDGSRSGVLISNDSKEEDVEFPQHSAPKRPEDLDCEIHNIRVKDEDWMIMVGLVDGKPYEVIGGLSENIEIPKSVKEGILRKVARKTKSARYDLSVDSGLVIRDVVKIFDNYNNEVLTRMISLSLRHGTSVSHVVEQLKKDKNSDMFSFSRSLSRVLKKYIQDGTEASSEHCPSCKSKKLIYQDGCVQCQECGWSGCS